MRMLVSYRNTLILIFLCVGFIAAATAVKVHRLVTNPDASSISSATTSKTTKTPTRRFPSPIFFRDSESSVPEGKTVISSTHEEIRRPPGLPGVTALAYLAGNARTGEVYLEHNPSQTLPVASMSKLVTAFVATNELPLDEVVEITAQAVNVPSDESLLLEGERFTRRQLLEPLLLSSSNVAAESLASSMERAKFLELMNAYSWEIGMPSTYFADPSGVNPKNVASALDLFALAKYLYNSRPDILALTRNPGIEIATTTEHGSHIVESTHPFVRDSRFVGGKTGRTPKAGDTMLTILNIGNEPVAIVVLGSVFEGRASDTRILADKVEQMLKSRL